MLALADYVVAYRLDIRYSQESSMAARESLDPDSSMWHWIAVDLHFWRNRSGLSCAGLGEILDISRGAVSNLEAARPGFRLSERQAKILDAEWGLNGHFERLLRYAKSGHDPDWFKTFTQYEARAIYIKVYEALVIPGLLQTPAYARALLMAGGVEDLEASVDRRMSRQEVLTRPRPAELWALVKQTMLEEPVGGPDVMRAQLEHLIEMSRRPNVFLRVVPKSVGAHLGLDGSFSVMTVASGNAAYMEAVGGGRLSTDSAEIHRFTVRFERIGVDALSRDSSRSLMAELMETIT
ncbi:DUF5753 domain-containing protein [Actinomadura sp. HBU206391]|uniref:DUF5753 domain-containing protein n=1 Tax=Actinomadura sp. HBU206391 TaxID=2731692 RepID=UPI00164FAF1C|nr:DUF5753 domain-containing protein [Actinomadura sp. HBU206391]MBC6459722.1 hypothetical protein [Actinomadura sp. HBU206391]